jgi:hypothetical protein
LFSARLVGSQTTARLRLKRSGSVILLKIRGVKVIGKLIVAKDGDSGFGHLGWARIMFDVVKVEKYEPVSPSAPQPRTESKSDK